MLDDEDGTMNIENLFYEMKKLSETSDKFFMNKSVYRGKNVAVFDYSLTIPADFCSEAAFECRGSVFEIDDNDNFVSILCRPYEKFLNLHEYDYDTSGPLHDAVKTVYGAEISSSDDIKALDIDYVLDKVDGSIISAFNFYGEMDMKSNSSLTSEYKENAMETMSKDIEFFELTKNLTDNGYTVNFEFISDNPKYQIVMPHDSTRLIVTGVRHNLTGKYFTHEEMCAHFGAKRVVDVITTWSYDDVKTRTDTEGYVVVTKCGLRYKLKTEWYIRRHTTKENFLSSARHFWEAFLAGDTDDVYAVVKGVECLESRFYYLVEKSNALFESIINEGYAFYEDHKELSTKDYFIALNKTEFSMRMSGVYAANLKNNDHKRAQELLVEKLCIKRVISELGVSGW